MSDVESEADDLLENPNPESDIQPANAGVPDNNNVDASPEDQATGNADTESDEASTQDNTSSNAGHQIEVEGDRCNSASSEAEHSELSVFQGDVDHNELDDGELNNAGFLAEGDQHCIRESGATNSDPRLNNSNDLAAEDEQYLVQTEDDQDATCQPESDIQCLNHEREQAFNGHVNEIVNACDSHDASSERTESCNQLESDGSRNVVGTANTGVSEARDDLNQEAVDLDGACASSVGDIPESEIGESQNNSEAFESVVENEPTESDQEVEGDGEIAYDLSVEHVHNEQINEHVEAGASDTNVLEAHICEPPTSDIDGENVQQNSNEGVPEDEMNVVAAESINVTVENTVDSFQPECDQSESEVCEELSSHDSDDRVEPEASNHAIEQPVMSQAACAPASPENGTVKRNKDNCLEETIREMSTSSPVDIEVEVKCEETQRKLPDVCESSENSRQFENGELSRETGAIPKYNRSRKAAHDAAKQPITVSETMPVEAEDDLLSELDATLKDSTEPLSLEAPTKPNCNSTHNTTSVKLIEDSDSDIHEGDNDAVSCEQCLKNNLKCSLRASGDHKGANCNIPRLKEQLHQAKQLLMNRECEIDRLREDIDDHRAECDSLRAERDLDRKEIESLRQHNADELYIPQIKELEYTIAQQQNDIRGLKEKLSAHDVSAKRAIATLQSEMKVRVDQVTKQYEEARREKDSMVMKYAQAEHKNLEFQKRAERAETKLHEMDKERAVFLDRMRLVKEQRAKLAAELEARNSEFSGLTKELDKQRELVSSGDIRVKWAQNKLKAELEGHKDTKVLIDKLTVKLKEAKEETQMIRSDCQAMIKTYQESEEVKSNSLDKELRLKQSELLEHQVQKNNFELAHVKTQRELEQLKVEYQESCSRLTALIDKVNNIEAEKEQANLTVSKYGAIIQKQKKEVQELRDRVESLVQYKTDFTSAQEMIKTLDCEISELKIANKELMSDMDSCRHRETDKLELTAKLSRKNAELQSENTTLSNKVLMLSGEVQAAQMENQQSDTKLKDMASMLEKSQKQHKDETQAFNTKLAGKCKAVEDLSRKLEDEKDEIKTLKRKHANNIKDLTRQLQQVRRKLDNYEAASTNGDKDTLSLGSRTSSNGSINTLGIADQTNTHVIQPSHTAQNSVHRNPSPEREYPVITEQVEVDKQTLIDRIVKLQKTHARKNEKIEFMEDHVSQLIDEIQKKNKIIQSLVLKEESGTMTSEVRDKCKAEISQKHSIMGSVYSSHSNDGSMTLDLSLQINRKIQAVLEDTLLKNMTLKESLDTLGQEIARLSQENRRLQLHMHSAAKPRSRTNPSTR